MRFGWMSVFAASLLFGGAVLAQSAGPAMNDQMRSQSASLRAQWQARAAAGLTPGTVVEPSITSAKVLTPEIDVTKAPGLPKFAVNVAAGTVGLASFSVTLVSPSGTHMVNGYFAVPAVPAERAHEVLAFQLGGGGFGQNQLGLYAEPGEWSVNDITLVTNDGQFVSYFQTMAAKLFPGGNNLVKVSNPNTPDVAPPTVAQGDVLTHSISLSAAKPYAVLRLPATDAVSGVASEAVTLTGPMGSNGAPAQINVFSSLLAPAASTPGVLSATLTGFLPPGIYTISYLSVCDAVSNCVFVDTPGGISAYFSRPEIRVTK